ncbi:MAG: DNA repair protein RecN [Bacteroidales bacterium]|nr:DNA repair protein RecN [Bacteroidales bacterium]
MLTALQVRNYVLIDSLEIDFPEGLIIITGQTGAGKSILLGALGLVMGSKADSSMVSEGADNCVVEAEFETSDMSIRDVLEENEAEWEDGHLTIRRVVNRSGRSRAFVNDCPVPVIVLQDIASRLVDIHSQHQTLLLNDKAFQLDILDHYAGVTGLRQECARLWKMLSELRNELKGIDEKLARLAGERDYNEAQLKQLDAASLREGELEELEEEQKQLANAEEIKAGLAAVEELFTSASSGGDLPSVTSSLKEAGKQLVKVGRYVPAASELAERVETCRRELEDILDEVVTVNSGTALSETRLEEVENRMSLIYGLLQKHSCADLAELIAFRDRLSDTLVDSTLLEEKRMELKAQVAETQVQLNDIASRLHEKRASAALPFASSIAESIREMELPYAVFEVILNDVPVSATGCDSIEFRFSSTGKNAVDVAKCASGGEMSRIMLALKSMMARYANMPTMIFDEIDTGVSGSVADKMGSVICSMGEFMQVFAITHLPQVAAKGSAHYMVSKSIDPETSKAVSTIKKLSDEQRVMEVARMLSGSELTDAAIANAKSLILSSSQTSLRRK